MGPLASTASGLSAATVVALSAALVIGYMAFRLVLASMQNPRGLPLPPGPPGKPFVGNVREIPTTGYEWLAYGKLAKVYGDLIYFSGLGNSVLSINSYKVANDLLDKKGNVYSDRPRLPMIKEMAGWAWNLVLMSYSEGFTEYRKVVQLNFQPKTVASSYRPVIIRETRALLRNMRANPDRYFSHIKHMAGAVIMMITYGHQVVSSEDEFVKLAEDVREGAATFPGSHLVDLIPILKYTPAWLPGQKFAKHAAHMRTLSLETRDRPYQRVKEQLVAGTAIPSLTSRLIEENVPGNDPSTEDFIRNVTGVIYSAGADTTVTAIMNFLLAMMLYPEVQERAQEESDRVIGRDRIPTFSDRVDLPYVSALVKETLRWMPVAPLGVVHCTTEADEYEGHYIPKATTVIPNIAAMLHDESTYPDPDRFDPSRFLGEKPNPDPARAGFGFGRRICPGRYFADDSLFSVISSIIHTFRISRPMDVNGQPVELKVEWASGLVALPSEFPCDIQPRPETEQLILDGTLE